MNCILENTSVLPSSNFVDFIHRASRICLGQSAKALVWRWRQICPLKIKGAVAPKTREGSSAGFCFHC